MNIYPTPSAILMSTKLGLVSSTWCVWPLPESHSPFALAVALSKLHSPSSCATCRSHRATDWGSMPVLPSSTSGIFLQCTAPHSPPLRIVLRRVPCMHHPLSCFHAPRLELGELSPLRARNPPVSAPQVSKHDETQRSVYTRDVYLADVGDNVVELS